jgi:hypothetical protein
MADLREIETIRKHAMGFADEIGFRIEREGENITLYDGEQPMNAAVVSELLDISKQWVSHIALILTQSANEGRHFKSPELRAFALVKWTFDLANESNHNPSNPPNYDRYYTLQLLLEHITQLPK